MRAFLGEEILCELPPYQNASKPEPEHEPDNERPETEASSKQDSKRKKDKRERDRDRIRDKRAKMSDAEKAEAKKKAREAAAKRRAEMSSAEIPDLVESWILNMTAKGYQTTEKLSAKKPEPTKVTPEKSAKLSPRERKELYRAKRKLLLTEEAEANSVKARTKKIMAPPRREIYSINPPDHMPTSIFHPRNSE